ncbi:nonribosomal peptide synthetase 5 [Pyrenophora seminiperda CCB06]|uniref:Nonribosomal peptide synthetase 5 n=1 Tax=Pyrenophora seminiperda CCB06 TaxID=1302712 RepID=A0A3M7M5H8_9PLEO|nr:nonribosomal peptide synthetase 5 [Pyrenophora seminiperda CCB06]
MDVVAWSQSRINTALSSLSSPVALITTPCPGVQLRRITVSFRKEWLYSPLEDTDELYAQLDTRRAELQEDDLIWIFFTSRTTGKPKGVMVYHSAAYAYSLVKLMDPKHDFQSDTLDGIRSLLVFSVGFDGCASVIWSTLTQGNTLVMASPTSFPEVAATCDALMLTPSMLATLDPLGPYDRVRYIFMGAEDPSMDVVRRWIGPNRKAFTTYGPTETTCFITLGELKCNEEVTLGDTLPGVKVVVVDEHMQECSHGELLIAGVGLAAGYINNPDLTATKFIQRNGERFYRTGDFVRKTEKGQLVWAGRADSLVKNRGFFINLETEVEPALLSFDSVQSAVALKWRDRVIGYVQPATVDVEELRNFMKRRFDPFIVPDEIWALSKFPLTFNGKTDRRALIAQREEWTSQGDEDSFSDRHFEAYDALRLAFSKCLHIAFKDMDRTSSFVRLGGNSITAIRLSTFMKKYGYLVRPIQILRLDMIGPLEERCEILSNSDMSAPSIIDDEQSCGKAPATPTQRVFLEQSLLNPKETALIGISKYVGDPLAIPSAGELHAAFVKALSAHSIFQTRFNLTDFSLSRLNRLNLDWHEESVEEAEFDDACVMAEKNAWSSLDKITRLDNEIPYYHITCISVPDRKALAFVTRAHHVLLDVVSQGIIAEDVDRALAGDHVQPGPQIMDFARFMHKHKQENIEKAINMFQSMVEAVPVTSVLQPPSPRASSLEQSPGLIRLRAPTSLRKSALDVSARRQGITTSTMVYAAWALFLSSVTAWDQVGFRISLSGRTVPWPSAHAIVGAVIDRAPFGIAVSKELSVHKWLAEVHKRTLDILEFEGLGMSLPTFLKSDRRTNTTNVLCFLDMNEASTPNWTYHEMQKHWYLIDWYVLQENDCVLSVFEFQSRQIDSDWAREAAEIPGRILQGLVNATEETMVREILK